MPTEKPVLLASRPNHIIFLLLTALFFSASLAAADPQGVEAADPDERADAAEQLVEPESKAGAKADSAADSSEQAAPLSERERMRQELMEMAEGLETGENMDRHALRERFRTRQTNRRASWWKGGELAESLALSEQQKERLDDLHEAAADSQRKAGLQQRELQQALNAALAEADIDRITQVMGERADNAAEMQRAEDQWLGGVLEVLSRDQLQTLQSEYPRVLRSHSAQGRMFRER